MHRNDVLCLFHADSHKRQLRQTESLQKHTIKAEGSEPDTRKVRHNGCSMWVPQAMLSSHLHPAAVVIYETILEGAQHAFQDGSVVHNQLQNTCVLAVLSSLAKSQCALTKDQDLVSQTLCTNTVPS